MFDAETMVRAQADFFVKGKFPDIINKVELPTIFKQGQDYILALIPVETK